MTKTELVEMLEGMRIIITNPDNYTFRELRQQIRDEICINCLDYESEQHCETCAKNIEKE